MLQGRLGSAEGSLLQMQGGLKGNDSTLHQLHVRMGSNEGGLIQLQGVCVCLLFVSLL